MKTKIILFKAFLLAAFLFTNNTIIADDGCSPSWPFGCAVYDIEYYPTAERFLCYEGGSWHCSNPNKNENLKDN